MTTSIKRLIQISDYRRRKQAEYNEANGITPQTVVRSVQKSLHVTLQGRQLEESVVKEDGVDFNVLEVIRELEQEMQQAAIDLEYERAALLRDQIAELKNQSGIKVGPMMPQKKPAGKGKRKSGVKRKISYSE